MSNLSKTLTVKALTLFLLVFNLSAYAGVEDQINEIVPKNKLSPDNCLIDFRSNWTNYRLTSGPVECLSKINCMPGIPPQTLLNSYTLEVTFIRDGEFKRQTLGQSTTLLEGASLEHAIQHRILGLRKEFGSRSCENFKVVSEKKEVNSKSNLKAATK
jgi:hypothetical protein